MQNRKLEIISIGGFSKTRDDFPKAQQYFLQNIVKTSINQPNYLCITPPTQGNHTTQHKELY